ncbi:hypothetical protein AL755_00970 (plasmid) [Arthrobacter sp. ERGS1:01]|uniref:CAP domain-containing protein n=1 Tax=Arthrobacter sp. ERGS1:01 TaxID=1704044 RepID=UPI0006B528C3|nr:CAP domain-containing protein [Arthrobacter sp. ERGS1:01]ALE04310.1 hypothetical protein AL755_00970 [Arthrobacter sp. ERGS1:01]
MHKVIARLAGALALTVAVTAGVAAPGNALTTNAPATNAPATNALPGIAAAGTAAAAVAPAAASDLIKDSNIAQLAEVLTGINKFRASKKLAPVKFTPAIAQVSQGWSDTMGANANFSHNPNYFKGYPAGWTNAGEIIAARWDRSGAGLVQQWIDSKPHNAIMSDPAYTTVGIGIAFTNGVPAATPTRYTMYGTVNFAAYKVNPSPSYATVQEWQDQVNTPAGPAIKAGNLVARDGAGVLWNYGSPTLGNRKQLATGWNANTATFVVDWNQDGIMDLLTQGNNGDLSIRFGNRTGTLAAPVVIGRGWQGLAVTVGKWNKANKFPSVVAKDAGGKLLYYPNVDGRSFGAKVVIGSGWGPLTIVQIDFDGNGTNDLLARAADGKLYLYKGTGSNGFAGARTLVGSGWVGMTLTPAHGLKGAGARGIVAKRTDGTLLYYGMGAGSWKPAEKIGNGWSAYSVAASSD